MGAVCQCQQDLMRNTQSELNLFELERDYIPRMVVATEKFETEDQHT